jgi:copper transporter 1
MVAVHVFRRLLICIQAELWLRLNTLYEDAGQEQLTETTPFLWSGRNQVEVSKRAHIIKALLYAVQCFYAFMMM